MTGTDVPIVWRGRRITAFVPELLATRDLDLSNTTVGRTANARAALEHGAESMPHEYAALARLLLRAEGVASSSIEGVAAAVVDIVLAGDGHVDAGTRAGWMQGRRRGGSPQTLPLRRRRSTPPMTGR